MKLSKKKPGTVGMLRHVLPGAVDMVHDVMRLKRLENPPL